jgi:hypothetical protein
LMYPTIDRNRALTDRDVATLQAIYSSSLLAMR